MLTPLHHTTTSTSVSFLTGGPPRGALSPDPEDLLQLEQRLSTAAGQVADQIVLVQLTRATRMRSS